MEEEASTGAAGAVLTGVAGAFMAVAVAGLATAEEDIAEGVPTEVRDLSAEEIHTEAEAFAADHPTEPAGVPMADSADRAA